MDVTAWPQEIVDSVIELCRDSTNDLKNCSLVSTSWATASRRLLFHTITLGVVQVHKSRTQDKKPSGPQSFLQQFHQLDKILEETPYIAEQCIRCVKLHFKSYSVDPDTFDGGACFMLAQVLARLAQVQEFSLSLGKWASYPREAKNIIYAAIRQPSVSNLSVRASQFDSFPDLASLLIHSPGLKHLTLANLVIPESASELEDTSLLPVVYLESLRIDTHLPPAFSDSGFPIKVDRLRQLRLSLPAEDDAWKLLNQLISTTSTSISHLELSDMADHGELNQIYLFEPKKESSGAATLDFWRIMLNPVLRWAHFKKTLPWIVQAFNNIGSSSAPLENISVSVTKPRTMLDNESVGEIYFWTPCRQLDEYLAGAALPFLRKVRFSLTVLDSVENSVRHFDRKIRESFVAVSARPGTLLEVSVRVAHIYF